MSWNVQAATGDKGYAYVTASKELSPSSSLGVAELTRTADGDYYCFDLTFTPVTIVVSAGLNGSYIVGDVVGPNTLSSDRAAALCGKTRYRRGRLLSARQERLLRQLQLTTPGESAPGRPVGQETSGTSCPGAANEGRPPST